MLVEVEREEKRKEKKKLASLLSLLFPYLRKVGDSDGGRVAVDLGPLVRLGVLEAVDDWRISSF